MYGVLLATRTTGEPFPRVQAIPLPGYRVAFEIDGASIAEVHWKPDAPKPYVFPLVGPAGYPVTRIGHPHDVAGHRHHRSVWLGHRDVNGVNFWEETSGAAIRLERITAIADGADAQNPDSAYTTAWLQWETPEHTILLRERRTYTITALPSKEFYLDVTCMLQVPGTEPVILGKTPFGLLAVRVAKTMSVNDGGGTLRNSEGATGEKTILWHRARWVDYSGQAAPGKINGIAFFDAPDNPDFPTWWHVRGDGWMGASLTFKQPITIDKEHPLRFHYRLYIHGKQSPECIEQHWKHYAQQTSATSRTTP